MFKNLFDSKKVEDFIRVLLPFLLMTYRVTTFKRSSASTRNSSTGVA
jgi:hypothetical protein